MRISALSYPNPSVAHRGRGRPLDVVVSRLPKPLGRTKASRINALAVRMWLQPAGFDC
jgi:hypothetical protein